MHTRCRSAAGLAVPENPQLKKDAPSRAVVCDAVPKNETRKPISRKTRIEADRVFDFR
ncbi:hypothetical protein FTUN_3534 [Frigoriglobus tundricola]|uniref:Uncharacterized protein n=1 Tax=Frigoriglobus tundricola TaxID=2774151 RepID=A0A6M5YRC1_9BACT|nr:hypothetical protein FTUN_3534 [Frigoriglobus tundricola]